MGGEKRCEIGFPFVAQFLSGDFFQYVISRQALRINHALGMYHLVKSHCS